MRPDRRRSGIGLALLGQICRDLMIADFGVAEVPGIAADDAEAFLMAAGAVRRRDHRTMAKSLT